MRIRSDPPSSCPTRAQGPKDSCYEGGYFKLNVNVPDHYPLGPPSVRFVTKIFHPNIHFKVSAPHPIPSATTHTRAAIGRCACSA